MNLSRMNNRLLFLANINIKPVHKSLLPRNPLFTTSMRYFSNPASNIYKITTKRENMIFHQSKSYFSESLKHRQKEERKKTANEENEPDQQWFNIFKSNKKKKRK